MGKISQTDKQVESTLGLQKVARYLNRPQQFVVVADARAELKRTLERAEKSSVVLTSNGKPTAALVPFSTLESIRDAGRTMKKTGAGLSPALVLYEQSEDY